MLWGASHGGLELRSADGGVRLRATFPYAQETELAPGRREVFAPRAFSTRVERDEEVHLLVGHDYEKPLAARSAGTLTLSDTAEALTLDAEIPEALMEVSYVRDFLAAHRAGLVRGVSPGFRVRPRGERVELRGHVAVRTVTAAQLFEVSAVTRPAYGKAQIEARSWAPPPAPALTIEKMIRRWRL